MPLVSYDKPALTFEDQLDQLIRRGLVVEDRARALSVLERVSYYRLSAYWHPFRRPTESGVPSDDFVKGTSFDRAVVLYELDRELRVLFFDAIERVEIALRTAVTYALGHAFGAFAHMDAKNFESPRAFDHAEWLVALRKESERAKETFVEHYRQKYEGFPKLPIWMASELIAFGTLSKLFAMMPADQKSTIAKQWGFSAGDAESFIHALSHIRNICAHHGRLWNRVLGVRPKFPNGQGRWPEQIDNSRVYFLLYLLRHVTRTDERCDAWAMRLFDLLDRQASGILRAMGAPEDWRAHPLWSDVKAARL
ncbi:MAG: Abi family protein [Myxococcales bacterium]|jgi:abortive infection bacteriophage resistance protein|nr:Abi family protein [Myxococcales bacterium]